MTRYREIHVAGEPREMGRQIGEAARSEVRGFCEVALERVNETVCISRDRAVGVAEDSLRFAADYAPEYVEELRGIAEAAGVSLLDVMLLQVRNQFQPAAEAGCTSLSVAGSENEPAVVAQNWDNDPLLDEFTVVLTRRRVGKPALTTVTQAGLIAYIGFNDAGIGACLNTLPAPSRAVGVPHYFTLRRLYEATSLAGAVEAIRSAHRAIPANIMLATPDGPANLEVTIDDVHVLRSDDRNWIAHTNHCLHAELCGINDEFPELIQSHARKRRIDELLSCGRSSLERIKSALCDHTDHPRSICRHANDDEQTGFWQTVFSAVIVPETGQMHVTRGTPCDRRFETYRML